jgi:hypothetical protein
MSTVENRNTRAGPSTATMLAAIDNTVHANSRVRHE